MTPCPERLMSEAKYKAGDKVRMIWRTRYAPYGYEAELFMKDGRLHITGNDGRAYPFQPEHWKPVEVEESYSTGDVQKALVGALEAMMVPGMSGSQQLAAYQMAKRALALVKKETSNAQPV